MNTDTANEQVWGTANGHGLREWSGHGKRWGPPKRWSPACGLFLTLPFPQEGRIRVYPR